MQKVNIDCNLCGSNDFMVVSNFGHPFNERVRNVICKRCSLTYQNPIPSPEELAAHYHNYRDITIGIKTPTREYEEYAQPMAQYHYSFFREYCKKDMKILDVGCGAGTLMRFAVKDGLEAYGVNPDPGFGNNGPANYGLKEVQICLFEDAQFEPGTFDMITFNHVFEHFPDATAVLKKVRGLLNSEGLIYLSIPNNLTPHGQLEHNYFDEHINTFTPTTIELILRKMGFRIVKMSTYGYMTEEGLHHPYIDLVASKLNANVPLNINYDKEDINFLHDLNYLSNYRRVFNSENGWINVYLGILKLYIMNKNIYKYTLKIVKGTRILDPILRRVKNNIHAEPDYCSVPEITEFPKNEITYYDK
jgi:2-polyprenyl-3-methyl-5-hydroxy-6-metoxy-1,4-benzoquinol methylase